MVGVVAQASEEEEEVVVEEEAEGEVEAAVLEVLHILLLFKKFCVFPGCRKRLHLLECRPA